MRAAEVEREKINGRPIVNKNLFVNLLHKRSGEQTLISKRLEKIGTQEAIMSTYVASIEEGRPGWLDQGMCFSAMPVRLWSYLRRRALARRELASLQRYILSDIGLTRGAALAAANGHSPARAEPTNGNHMSWCSGG